MESLKNNCWSKNNSKLWDSCYSNSLAVPRNYRYEHIYIWSCATLLPTHCMVVVLIARCHNSTQHNLTMGLFLLLTQNRNYVGTVWKRACSPCNAWRALKWLVHRRQWLTILESLSLYWKKTTFKTGILNTNSQLLNWLKVT